MLSSSKSPMSMLANEILTNMIVCKRFGIQTVENKRHIELMSGKMSTMNRSEEREVNSPCIIRSANQLLFLLCVLNIRNSILEQRKLFRQFNNWFSICLIRTFEPLRWNDNFSKFGLERNILNFHVGIIFEPNINRILFNHLFWYSNFWFFFHFEFSN